MMLSRQFRFSPEGSFFYWIIRLIIVKHAHEDQPEYSITGIYGSFEEEVEKSVSDLYIDEIRKEADKLVNKWYVESIQEDYLDKKPVQEEYSDYYEYLADVQSWFNDPRHYTTAMNVPHHPLQYAEYGKAYPGVPRTIRQDADVPCIPGTVGYSYL